ncbi:MAG: recombinase family protein [Desulfuromonadales bacterium]|nr:recombinase family protein [Desulfuromonadales bacterium]
MSIDMEQVMNRIIGYARAGTTGQALAAQREALAGIGAVRVCQEQVASGSTERPQLSALLAGLHAGDTLAVTSLDRLARNTKHLLEITDSLHRRGVCLKVLEPQLDSTTDDGMKLLRMLEVIVSFERQVLLERQAEGIARARAEGRYRGRKPTARVKAKEILALDKQGLTRKAIAQQLEIGVASVYRVLKDHKPHKPKAAPVAKPGPAEKVQKADKKKPVRKKTGPPVDDRQQSLFDF